MIPTRTLRERLTEALLAVDERMEAENRPYEEWIGLQVEAAIEAIGDPVLIKTADSLEPTFTLRAQDKAAERVLLKWLAIADKHGCPKQKLRDALATANAFADWPTRKWPD